MNYVKLEKIDRIKVNRKTFNKKRIRKLIPFFGGGVGLCSRVQNFFKRLFYKFSLCLKFHSKITHKQVFKAISLKFFIHTRNNFE